MTPRLKRLVIVAAMLWAVAFIVIGLSFHVQMYGDGSVFSYAVAVEDAWAIHWHNISGRLAVYLACFVPAEAYVALTSDPRGGIALYGGIHFAAPLLGLVATYSADRSEGRVVFACACASMASLCPLVFGAPTEMWAAQSLFWPTFAVCRDERGGAGRAALVVVLMLALAFTHEGALLFEAFIVASLALRGATDAAFRRIAGAACVVLPVWLAVKIALPPDAYTGAVMERAALHVFDVTLLVNNVSILLPAALAGYGLIVILLGRMTAKAPLYATLAVAAALGLCWLAFDRFLLTQGRYYLRTALLVGTLGFALLATLQTEPWPMRLQIIRRLMALDPRTAIGAFALVMLVHAVETAKFVTAWAGYTSALRALAMSDLSDPALGDPRFVSAERIDPAVNRLSWNSTTPFLSILLAPGFAPARLVIDPTAGYFWLDCAAATDNEQADRAIPRDSRRLVRIEACERRP